MSTSAFPVRAAGLRGYWARRDVCPECGGDLDTGWECNKCGYDAMPDAHPDDRAERRAAMSATIVTVDDSRCCVRHPTVRGRQLRQSSSDKWIGEFWYRCPVPRCPEPQWSVPTDVLAYLEARDVERGS